MEIYSGTYGNISIDWLPSSINLRKYDEICCVNWRPSLQVMESENKRQITDQNKLKLGTLGILAEELIM